MRVWHKDLISVLPHQQLIGQWRECCSMARSIEVSGTPSHLLVNKIMEYPIDHFWTYGLLVAKEMDRRKYRCDFEKFSRHFPVVFHQEISKDELFRMWHTKRYLKQCYYNLQEKFDCGGIPVSEWLAVCYELQSLGLS